jgi:hypothetical protein
LAARLEEAAELRQRGRCRPGGSTVELLPYPFEPSFGPFPLLGLLLKSTECADRTHIVHRRRGDRAGCFQALAQAAQEVGWLAAG